MIVISIKFFFLATHLLRFKIFLGIYLKQNLFPCITVLRNYFSTILILLGFAFDYLIFLSQKSLLYTGILLWPWFYNCLSLFKICLVFLNENLIVRWRLLVGTVVEEYYRYMLGVMSPHDNGSHIEYNFLQIFSKVNTFQTEMCQNKKEYNSKDRHLILHYSTNGAASEIPHLTTSY
jgi:hypothetical protein